MEKSDSLPEIHYLDQTRLLLQTDRAKQLTKIRKNKEETNTVLESFRSMKNSALKDTIECLSTSLNLEEKEGKLQGCLNIFNKGINDLVQQLNVDRSECANCLKEMSSFYKDIWQLKTGILHSTLKANNQVFEDMILCIKQEHAREIVRHQQAINQLNAEKEQLAVYNDKMKAVIEKMNTESDSTVKEFIEEFLETECRDIEDINPLTSEIIKKHNVLDTIKGEICDKKKALRKLR